MPRTKKSAATVIPQPALDPVTYPNLQPIINTVAAFARISRQWVYVADIIRRTYLYISETPGATLGTDAQRLTSEGYNLIIDRVIPSERLLYNEMIRAIENLIDTVDPEQRKRIEIKFDITSMVGDRPRLLCHAITPLVTADDGHPWIILSMLSPSMYKESGHLFYRLDGEAMEYDLNQRDWHPVDSNVRITTCERNMLILSARGYTIEEISHLMYRSIDTVKMYRRTLFKKLGVSNINEALFHAIKQNLL